MENGTHDYAALNLKLRDLKKRVLSRLTDAKKSQSFEKIYLKYQKAVKKEPFYDYPDNATVKLLADNKTSYQTVISIMDAARTFKEENGQKIPLFPDVSIGVMK